MATKKKPSDGKLMFIRFARCVTYLVYAYCIVASIFLAIGAFLLLFSANTSSSFVNFIYKGAENFLEPFRGIFPPHQVSDTGYFSTAAVFAIIIYLLIAAGVHSLITYITAKKVLHEQELQAALEESQREEKAAAAPAPRPPAARPTSTARPVGGQPPRRA